MNRKVMNRKVMNRKFLEPLILSCLVITVILIFAMEFSDNPLRRVFRLVYTLVSIIFIIGRILIRIVEREEKKKM